MTGRHAFPGEDLIAAESGNRKAACPLGVAAGETSVCPRRWPGVVKLGEERKFDGEKTAYLYGVLRTWTSTLPGHRLVSGLQLCWAAAAHQAIACFQGTPAFRAERRKGRNEGKKTEKRK